jgi:hypothetical protein
MATIVNKRLIIIAFSLSSFVTFGQPSTKVPTPVASSQINNSAIRNRADSLNKAFVTKSKEADFYKLMYENEKNTSARFISLTQWTLGGALGVLLAIVGLQSLFNFRINSTKIDEIRAGLRTQFAELALELTGRISEEAANAISANNSNSKDLEKRIKEVVLLKIDSAKARIDRQIELKGDELTKEIHKVKATSEKNSGEISILNGNKSGALSNFIKVAELKISLHEEEKYILKDIIRLIKEQSELYILDYKSIEKILPNIKESNQSERNEIQELTGKLPVYEFRKSKSTLFPFGAFDKLGFPFSHTKTYIRNAPKSA